MNENVLNRMMELLDIHQKHCLDYGASVTVDCLGKPTGGNAKQNSYYYGHLNMAQAIALEIGKDIIKVDGKHKLVDGRR